jgi:hypothetical protein
LPVKDDHLAVDRDRSPKLGGTNAFLDFGFVLGQSAPFAESKEQLGGFFVFEASDMNHAIELLSEHPEGDRLRLAVAR